MDWTILGYHKNEPYQKRSNRQQIFFNDEINEKTNLFIKEVFLPEIKSYFSSLKIKEQFHFYINAKNPGIIEFEYPKKYNDSTMRQVISIEIGCLAKSIPCESREIKSYIEKVYDDFFKWENKVITTSLFRTFFEKLTLIHRECNRTNGNYPVRYSRHFYDVYKILEKIGNDEIFSNIHILQDVIEFKKKFYSCNWAKYDDIIEGKLKLLPNEEAIHIFSKDYELMGWMFIGKIIPFDEIMNLMHKYQEEFNKKVVNLKWGKEN
ncbi:Nucleotidyl transferase of uncharacterised function (DUF1814) [Mycoplasmopsis glycophila]|uniref:Nucleotidyl transferase of uncharacterized function (DUF1814) n=1 Tax=Mycoplasmopsis glycophila TaxID=171285 RepID=A0A449AW54_9BACT|nr:Nucleotidyl transferase of uncharacterised function (DUF1814) [Mycoplasmopsis glycophila]